jgi:hypothetical protein
MEYQSVVLLLMWSVVFVFQDIFMLLELAEGNYELCVCVYLYMYVCVRVTNGLS